jgi:hypothetical protein
MEPSGGMGQPQRAAQDERASASERAAQSTSAAARQDEPLVSVHDWFDEEESAPWCVDRGVAIEVMSTRSIYEAVDSGQLSPDMKVWRDGRACWLPIAECYELTVKPPPRRSETPVSAVRRIRKPSLAGPTWPATGMHAPDEVPSPTSDADPEREGRSTLMLTTSFAIGVVIGALLYLPFAW